MNSILLSIVACQDAIGEKPSAAVDFIEGNTTMQDFDYNLTWIDSIYKHLDEVEEGALLKFHVGTNVNCSQCKCHLIVFQLDLSK